MAKTISGHEYPAQTYLNGKWHQGSPPVLAPNMQAMWLSTIPFAAWWPPQGGPADFEGKAKWAKGPLVTGDRFPVTCYETVFFG